ncbi:MAG TPA: hypothetical protein VGJ17_05620, partial [Candidatus Limnocylindrales bacterium]
MPFGFGKRDGKADEAQAAADASATAATALTAAALAPHPTAGGIAFDGVTEEWRLVGVMEVKGR